MTSRLRVQMDAPSTPSFHPQRRTASPPTPKSRMSLTQTYRVASTARGKLGMEAARPDHDLRLLVCHANLLDSLMLELAQAEREQEAWFNESIHNSNRGESAKHIQWFDSIAEENDAFGSDSDSDSDSDEEIEVADFPAVASLRASGHAAQRRRRSPSPPPAQTYYDFDDEDEDEDEDEQAEDFEGDAQDLVLTRVASHPPELVHSSGSDSESDDESMPPSPSQPTIDFDDATSKPSVQAEELFPEQADALDLVSPSPRRGAVIAVY